jgi:hypothetical protein
MVKRTTLEVDEYLLERAKLGDPVNLAVLNSEAMWR